MTTARRATTDGEAAWRAVVADICGGIPGRYPIGEQVPTYREMASRHGVSLTPVRTAYGLLKQAGILRAEAGRAVWVARAPRPAEHLDGPTLAAQVRTLTVEVATLRHRLEEVSARLEGQRSVE